MKKRERRERKRERERVLFEVGSFFAFDWRPDGSRKFLKVNRLNGDNRNLKG